MAPHSASHLPQIAHRSRRALTQERDALDKTLEAYTKDPKTGCTYLFERKDAWKIAPHRQRNHRQRLWADAINQSTLIVGNVMDHLWSISQLLNGDALPIYAHMTLSRVLTEAAARVCYLLDPNIDHKVRIVRGAILGISSTEAKLTASRSIPVGSPAASNGSNTAIMEHNKLEDRIKRAGLTFRLNAKNERTHLQDGAAGISEPMRLNLTTLVEKHFPDRPAWYRLSSGVIHSSRWMLTDVITASDQRGMTMTPDLLGIGTAAVTAIDASQAVLKAYAQFYGHDPQPAARASAFRINAVDLLVTEFAASQGLI